MIVLDNVSKSYDGQRVVDQVSLNLAEAGLTSIIGSNGAGKSTLLSMIINFEQSDTGSIRIDGRELSDYSGRELASTLSILRQSHGISSRLRVRELVMFGRFPYHRGRPGEQDHEKVDEVLRYLNITDVENRFIDQLSGGQQQRAMIAMALAQDTPYLLLDEPLNNLDMKHSVEMMKLLRRFADELGRKIVIVIHDINFASCYSDRIVALAGGKLVFQGTPEALMTTEVLEQVFGFKMPIHEIDNNKVSFYYT